LKKIIIASLLCGYFAACSESYFANVETTYPEGRELYISKCGGCHRLHKRNEFTAAKWDSILVSMQKKSKTSNEQIKRIFNFLVEGDSINPAADN